jgi:hypothetical protein
MMSASCVGRSVLTLPRGGLSVRARLQPLHAQVGFHVAQRDGKQRRALRAFGKALDDAKGRRCKLGQRRQTTRGHLERKALRIGQGPARGVLQVLGQLQRVGRALGQGRGKLHAAHQLVGLVCLRLAAVVFLQPGLDHLLGRLEPQARRQLARYRGTECHRERADRQAGSLGVFALAGEFGGERRTHLVGEALLHRIGHAAGRGHPLAPHQLHLGRRREAPGAGQRLHRQRLLRRTSLQALGLEQGRTLLAIHQAHRHALSHAVELAPGIGLHALQRGGAVELQHEILLFVDGLVGAGTQVLHERPAAIELIASSALQWGARGRFEVRLDVRRAAHPRWQVALEVVHPFALAGPAARTLADLRVAAAQFQRRRGLGITEGDDSTVKLGHHLAHPRHLALRRKLGDLQSLGAAGGQQAEQPETFWDGFHTAPSRIEPASVPNAPSRHVAVACAYTLFGPPPAPRSWGLPRIRPQHDTREGSE